MNFSIEKLSDEPIIICTLGVHFDPVDDYPTFWPQLGQAIEGMEAPIYRITHLLSKDYDFGQMTVAIAEETRNGFPGSIGDPRVRSVLVSQAAMVQLGIESLQQEQYGQLDHPIFGTLEEALAFVREQLA